MVSVFIRKELQLENVLYSSEIEIAIGCIIDGSEDAMKEQDAVMSVGGWLNEWKVKNSKSLFFPRLTYSPAPRHSLNNSFKLSFLFIYLDLKNNIKE